MSEPKKEVRKNHAQLYGAGQAGMYTAAPDELKIVTDRRHALFQSRALAKPDPVLVADMVENGWLKSSVVLVYVDPETKERMVSDGRGRTLAARAATIIRAKMDPPREPILVQYALDPKGSELATWERMQQANVRVHYGPLDIAEAIAGARAGGYPDDKLAEKLSAITGKRIEAKSFGRRLRLLEASSATKKALAAGEITEAQALCVAGMTAEEQAATLSEDARTPERAPRGGPSRAMMRRIVDAYDSSDRRLDDCAPVVAALQWVLGDADDRVVAGLDTLLARVEENARHDGPPCKTTGCSGVGARRRKGLCAEHYEVQKK